MLSVLVSVVTVLVTVAIFGAKWATARLLKDEVLGSLTWGISMLLGILGRRFWGSKVDS